MRWLPADARIHIRARGAEAQLAVRRGEQRPLPSGPPHAVAADPPPGALEREEADAGIGFVIAPPASPCLKEETRPDVSPGEAPIGLGESHGRERAPDRPQIEERHVTARFRDEREALWQGNAAAKQRLVEVTGRQVRLERDTHSSAAAKAELRVGADTLGIECRPVLTDLALIRRGDRQRGARLALELNAEEQSAI